MKKNTKVALIAAAIVISILGLGAATHAQNINSQNSIKAQMVTPQGRMNRDRMLYKLAKQRRDDLQKNRAMAHIASVNR